jgi:TonB family protein
MMIQKKSAKFFGGALLTLAIACAVSAQEKPQTTDAAKQVNAARIERNIVLQTGGGGVISSTPNISLNSAFAFGQGGTFDFVSTEMSLSGKVVKGAPYSATGVTERTQTLADGNRIVNKSSSQFYRDAEGRTRREQTGSFINSFMAANSAEAPRTIFINDPVAGVNYILNEKDRTARKLTPMKFDFPDSKMFESYSKMSTDMLRNLSNFKGFSAYPPEAKAAGVEGFVPVKVTINDAGEVVSAVATDGHPLLRQAAVDAAKKWVFDANNRRAIKNNETTIGYTYTLSNTQTATRVFSTPSTPYQVIISGGDVARRTSPPNTKTESLGKQMIEGIEAEGTRTTTTIPAGKIGNERDIDIVSERWYSPELQVVVITKQDDPRTGTNVYRLTNISRGEPARTLFEVPADYTIKANEPNVLRSLRMKKEE